MKDFLGNEYDVGDKVLYAAGSGRSITMILAEVVEIYEIPKHSWDEDGPKVIKVKVQPLNSSRWEQHRPRVHYIDERTGETISPWSKTYDPDVWSKQSGYYDDQGNRKEITDEDYHYKLTQAGFKWVPGVLQPYIKEIKEPPKPVTITITKNIVKWQGTNKGDAVRLSGIKSREIQPEYEERHPEWKACKE